MLVCVLGARRVAAALLLVCLCGGLSYGYSVLSHEAVVDALWTVALKRVLLQRFPAASEQQLKEAHAYAYGGAIIQDLGYYPHGSKQFSDLTHYVRTGDFILALLAESKTLDEYAFALGALSHYVSDLDGHRFATNVAEPMLYPKLRKRFGDFVVYEDSPIAHLETEFGFDVLQVAKGNFAPEAYHDFIGFDVAKGVLGRAFHDTYGLELQDVFGDFDRAIASYRHAVSKTIPMATRVAWASQKDRIQSSEPGMTRRRFVYVMSRSSYEREWGKQYDRPTFADRVLAVLLKLLPPLGPLRALRFKMPTPPAEKLFMESFNRSAEQYRARLEDTAANRLRLPNENYDVGVITPAGVYRLDDDVQAYWLDKLAQKEFRTTTEPIAQELFRFYGDLEAPIHTKVNKTQWSRTRAELQALRGARDQVASASEAR